MQIFVNLITRAIFMSTPLVLGALGEVLAERTGMMVTAIEGIFLVGAWGGFIGAYLSGNLLIGFLLAMVCGLIVSLLYGVTTIYMHQHQIVMGTAVAILVTGCCTFFYRVIFGIQTVPLKVNILKTIKIPLLSKIPIIGQAIFSQNLVTYFTYILVPIIFFVIYKTSLGLSMRSCGENPEAADAAGINVTRTRFLAVAVAGCLGGKAKAMVITSSRPAAVKYRQEFEKYIQAKGYTGIKALVAFSGKVKLDDKEYTEVSMNDIKEEELRFEFDRSCYQVLIVADKYQTGF